MKVIRLSENAFDFGAEFKVSGVRGGVSLQMDYKKAGDGILWGLQGGGMLKAHYSEAERAHKARMQAMEPIENGEIVSIDGETYRTRVLGNFSDCVIFDKEEQKGEVLVIRKSQPLTPELCEIHYQAEKDGEVNDKDQKKLQ